MPDALACLLAAVEIAAEAPRDERGRLLPDGARAVQLAIRSAGGESLSESTNAQGGEEPTPGVDPEMLRRADFVTYPLEVAEGEGGARCTNCRHNRRGVCQFKGTLPSGVYIDIYGQRVNKRNCCILPGMKVEGDFLVASESGYAGQSVQIRTASGHDLCVTVNHPVLTEDGFVPAGQLKQGDRLVCDGCDGEVPNLLVGVAAQDDVKHAPATAQQVFRSLAALGFSVEAASPLDFHGDGEFIKGDVKVVRTSRFLMSRWYASGQQAVDDLHLPAARLRQSPLAGDGKLLAFGHSHGTMKAPEGDNAVGSASLSRLSAQTAPCSLDGCPGSFDVGLSGIGGHSLPVQPARFSRAAKLDAGFCEPPCNNPGANPGVPADFLDGGAGFVPAHEFAGRDGGEMRVSLLPREQFGFAHGSEADAGAGQDGVNIIGSLPNGASDCGGRFAGKVALDDVVEVRHFHYEGPVYDFKTTTGLIVAEGIYVSNCDAWDQAGTVRDWQSPPSGSLPESLTERVLRENGFTGVDAHGHHWQNGKQVKAHADEPGGAAAAGAGSQNAVPALPKTPKAAGQAMADALAYVRPEVASDPALRAKVAANWAKELKGRLISSGPDFGTLQAGIKANLDNKDFAEIVAKRGPQAVVLVKGEGSRRAESVGASVLVHSHDIEPLEHIQNPPMPGMATSEEGGGIAAVLRHEYAHRVFGQLGEAQRMSWVEKAKELYPNPDEIKKELTQYAGVHAGRSTNREEVFTEAFAVGTSPGYDSATFSPRARQLIAVTIAVAKGSGVTESIIRESGFTGIDSHGHQWENGKQVKRSDTDADGGTSQPHDLDSALADVPAGIKRGIMGRMKNAVHRVAVKLNVASLSPDILDTIEDTAKIWYRQAPPIPGVPLSSGQLVAIGSHVLAKAILWAKKKLRGTAPASEAVDDASAADTVAGFFEALHEAIPLLGEPPTREQVEEMLSKRQTPESIQVRTRRELRVLMEAGFTGQVTTKSGSIWFYRDGKRVANPNKQQAAPKKPRATPAEKQQAAQAKQQAAADKKAAKDKAKQDAAAVKAKEKEDAARQYASVRDNALAAAKEIAGGKTATPEQLAALGQAVLTLNGKDLQALKKATGAAGGARTKGGAVDAIKDAAKKAAAKQPKPEPTKAAAKEQPKEAPATPKPVASAPHHLHTAASAVAELASKGGQADMVHVRAALSKAGISDRAQQDQTLNDLRRKGVLTASPYEGRHGLTPDQLQARLPEPGAQPGEMGMGLLALKPGWEEALAKATGGQPAASGSAREHGAKLKALVAKTLAEPHKPHTAEISQALEDAARLSPEDLHAAATEAGIYKPAKSKPQLLAQLKQHLEAAHQAHHSIQV